MKDRIIFIGPAGGKGIPTNGASAKNYHLLKHLGKLGYNIKVIDTEHWKRNPLIAAKMMYTCLFRRKAKYIVAANSSSSYRAFQMFRKAGVNDVVYWAIGGSVADWIKNGTVSREPYSVVKWFLVEGESMKQTLNSVGFDNVLRVPNFKNLPSLPEKTARKEGSPLRFVFLSRIIPEKGCDLILEAVEKLNAEGLEKKFSVDFYGPIDNGYIHRYTDTIKKIDNVCYKGFLDLKDGKGYDELAGYDVMLFPTYWHGEGFPGIIIDAFVSGLPVLASKHRLNGELIEEGSTGWLVESKSVDELAQKMKEIIANRYDLALMAEKCQCESARYSTENVITSQLAEKIGL